MTILVTGATGTVGQHVTDLLVKRGMPVRALTRNPGQAKTKLPEGVQIAAGDLMKPETLREVMQGVEAVFLITSSDEPEADLDTDPQVVALAEAAGVKRVVVLVGFEEGPVEAALQASGMQWTLVKPAEFMANVLADWRDMIRTEGIVREFYGEALSARVHEGDIAAVAVRALLEDGHHGRTYALTGPEALTRKEAVRTIAAAIGKDIPFVELTEEEARQQWRDQGYDEESVEFFVQMAKNTPEAGYTVLPTTLQVLGRPARTFAEWAKEHKQEFL
ncbi:NAD-dependent epimerase/dehydratase family protein [Paenibacillus oralis]|uniref:NAD-dependent epimerase/dehydratase family protein n=1 Tax=Paenibacillus oralis TaxID=2490856 RepID=A0A3P3U0W5_9BACL|nr:NAD(P)H-binding protein [Paenibacillus oralis]RRJ63991.1 NAD-dependent epimerase/dehydratase family protein [Paenibacillus oralis]